MNDYQAKMALRTMGIVRPDKQMIENYMRAEAAEQQLGLKDMAALPAKPTPQPRSDGRRRGSSRSNLAPVLRQQGQLTKKVKTGQRGRPRIYAEWFPEVAASVASGLSLPEALAKHGISLDANALRALSRNKEFRRLLEQERQRELAKRKLVLASGSQTQATPVPAEHPETQNSSSAERQLAEPDAR